MVSLWGVTASVLTARIRLGEADVRLRLYTTWTTSLLEYGKIKIPATIIGHRDCIVFLEVLSYYFLLRARSMATAIATVAPTMGLLPIPRKPIISTWAGTEEEPAN